MAWLTGWQYRKKITIDHNKIDSGVADFPVLVKLTSSNFDFSKARSDGYDIRFTDSDGVTLLKYERERHDAANQKAEYWVRIPAVSSTTDTEFYIYYGKPDASDGADPTDVWDGNFKMVQHMKDDPDASHIKDSTVNANDGTKKAANEPVEADGKIAKAQDFDGDNDYISIPDFFSNEGQITVEMWVKFDDISNSPSMFESQSDTDRFSIYLTGTAPYQLDGIAGGNGEFALPNTGGTDLSTGIFYHIAYVFNKDSGLYAYLNGVLDKSDTGTATPISGGSPKIGARSALVEGRFTDGIIDEVRISNTVRGAAWIKASYHSGNDTLVSYGSEETLAVPRSHGYIFG